MTVRILRLIEYVYESAEKAEEGMMHWLHPPIGSRNYGPVVVRSTILTDLNFREDETETR